MSRLLREELDTTVAKFHFLCCVRTRDIPPPTHDQCAICQEPYRTNDWQLGGTVHCPVTLPCGHILGLQCLARWITSSTYVNNCPLCRAKLIDPPTMARERLLGPIASAFARLETVAVVESNGISRSQRARLFEALWSDLRRQKSLWGCKDGGERIMVAWEEFYYLLCAHTPENFVRNPDRSVARTGPLAQANSHRQALAGQPARQPLPPRNGEVRMVFSKWQVRAALFVAMVGVAYVPSAYLYDLNTGRRDTFTALLLSTATFLISCVAARSIATAPGLPDSEGRYVMLGWIVGAVLGVGVRRFDVLIHKWWMKGMEVVFFPRH